LKARSKHAWSMMMRTVIMMVLPIMCPFRYLRRRFNDEDAPLKRMGRYLAYRAASGGRDDVDGR
jgi:hypothetical protein